jgi:radical SAM protein with 4Fe4S-binding SPASM domain|tara:strand:- start:1971 stop:3197 length:1227 start_codon:yes stop_codon:yes gene_type:complete
MEEETYCVLAYNHLSIDPQGQVRPCCNYNFHKQSFRDTKWKFKSIWNSDNLADLLTGQPHVELRKDIEKNHKHTFCDRCWVSELNGGESYRNMWNDIFKCGTKDKFQHEIKIEYVEFTLGNKCNIQCRMCNPWSSSMWADEIYKNPQLDFWDTAPHLNKDKFEWYYTPQFDKIFAEILPTLKHVNMLGGEPLFNAKYYEILQHIIDSGRSKDIVVQFNSNMLAIQSKVYDLWKQFKSIHINMSCDGVEGVNEYVRWPGKWSKWERNLNRVFELQQELGEDKLRLQVHSTLSSLTWLDLGNLYNYTATLPIGPTLPFLIQVTQPAQMDAIHLPQSLKDKGYEQAITAIENADAEDWEVSNNRSLLEHVMNTERDPDKWEQFIVETNQLDKVRKQSILSFIPEFEEYWHE